MIGGGEAGKKTRFYIQEIGGAPQAITPEGTTGGRLSPDGKFVLAKNGGKYFLYPTAGGEPRFVE